MSLFSVPHTNESPYSMAIDMAYSKNDKCFLLILHLSSMVCVKICNRKFTIYSSVRVKTINVV